LEYKHYISPKENKGKVGHERRLLVFVVRPDKDVQVVELGKIEPIRAAIDPFRQGMNRKDAATAKDDPGAELRRLVWQPVETHLQGTKTVLITPDRELARIAWAALPGAKAGSYLLEEYALALVPVPHLLPELLAGKKDGKDDDTSASLLAFGAVEFGAAGG